MIRLSDLGARPQIDNADILNAVLNDRNFFGRSIHVDGIYRLCQPVAMPDNSVNLVGEGPGTGFLIDLSPSEDAFVLGRSDASRFDLLWRDLWLYGGAGCCRAAVRAINYGHIDFDRVAINVGAVEWALRLEGCIYGVFRVKAHGYWGRPAGDLDCATFPANGILLTRSASGMMSNANRIHVDLKHTAVGVRIDDPCAGYSGGGNVITGTFSNCGGHPIHIRGCGHVSARDIYVELCGPLRIEDSHSVALGPGIKLGQGELQIAKCADVQLDGATVKVLDIDEQTHRTRLGSIRVGALNDDGCGTQYLGPVFLNGRAQQIMRSSPVPTTPINLVDNADFAQWDVDRPAGWGTGSACATWVQCGDDLPDTMRHLMPTCARLERSDVATVTYTVPVALVPALRGHYVAVALWVQRGTNTDADYIRLRTIENGTSTDYRAFARTVARWELLTVAGYVSGGVDAVQIAVYGKGSIYLSGLQLQFT